MTTIFVCTHPTVVGAGADKRLRSQLDALKDAVGDAADKAATILRGKGYDVELINSENWHKQFHGFARVHNWIAVRHGDLSPSVIADIKEAGKVYADALLTWEKMATDDRA